MSVARNRFRLLFACMALLCISPLACVAAKDVDTPAKSVQVSATHKAVKETPPASVQKPPNETPQASAPKTSSPSRPKIGRRRAFPKRFGESSFRGINMLSLIRVPQFHKDLQLSEEQSGKLTTIFNAHEKAKRELFSGLGKVPRTERKQRIADASEKYMELRVQVFQEIAEALTVDQRKRMSQIELQLRGIRALSDPTIARQLKLNLDQQRKTRAAIRAQDYQIAQLRQKQSSGPNQKVEIAAIRKTTEEKIVGLLTDDQRNSYDQMKGEPFHRRAVAQSQPIDEPITQPVAAQRPEAMP